MDKTVRFALIGFGYAGKTFHSPLISCTPGAELAAIVQRTGDSAHTAYPSAKICRSVEEMLSLTSIDVAVVATTNETHAPIAEQCLRAGLHVVVDKPMAVNTREAKHLSALAAEKQLLLSVFHNRRWDGDFLTLRTLVAEGRLGRITRFTTAFDRYRPTVDETAWRQQRHPGSGILCDLGPHLIDQTVELFGLPNQVFASIREEREGAHIDDAFDITFFYCHGLIATMSASMLAAAPRPRFTADGTLGSWLKLGLDPQEAALKAGRLPGSESWGVETESAHGLLTSPSENGAMKVERTASLPGDYPAYYANIRDAVTGKSKLIVTPQQALAVMELLELARNAHAQKCALSYTPGNLSKK